MLRGFREKLAVARFYVEEVHSDAVREWVDEAEIVAACRVAYPEAVSALSRRHRAGDIATGAFRSILRALRRDWGRLAVVDFDELEAGRLAAKHGLRGYDAVHLSSAALLAEAKAGPDVLFASFDAALNRAASREGLQVMISA
jgi:uncharacterized protein